MKKRNKDGLRPEYDLNRLKGEVKGKYTSSKTEKNMYLFINGIKVSRSIQLDTFSELKPAKCSPDQDSIISVFKTEDDVGVAALFLRRIASQLLVAADNPKQLAVRTWNSQWDILFIGAICDCEVGWNFQSDEPSEKFGVGSNVRVTNYALRGFLNTPYVLTDQEQNWIEKYFKNVRPLLKNIAFQTAVHALASYRWHSLPRARVALLWAGIESLFGIENELRFRLSLYIARFLELDNSVAMKTLFNSVQKLYPQRSKAVHGSALKENPDELVNDSAKLLVRLLKKCVEINGLPNNENLAP